MKKMNGQICFSLRKLLAISSAIQKIAGDCGCDALVHSVRYAERPRERNSGEILRRHGRKMRRKIGKIFRRLSSFNFQDSGVRRSGRKKFHQKSSTNSTSHETKFFHSETLGASGHKVIVTRFETTRLKWEALRATPPLSSELSGGHSVSQMSLTGFQDSPAAAEPGEELAGPENPVPEKSAINNFWTKIYTQQMDAAVLGDRLPEVTQKPFLGPKSLSLQCRH